MSEKKDKQVYAKIKIFTGSYIDMEKCACNENQSIESRKTTGTSENYLDRIKVEGNKVKLVQSTFITNNIKDYY